MYKEDDSSPDSLILKRVVFIKRISSMAEATKKTEPIKKPSLALRKTKFVITERIKPMMDIPADINKEFLKLRRVLGNYYSYSIYKILISYFLLPISPLLSTFLFFIHLCK